MLLKLKLLWFIAEVDKDMRTFFFKIKIFSYNICKLKFFKI